MSKWAIDEFHEIYLKIKKESLLSVVFIIFFARLKILVIISDSRHLTGFNPFFFIALFDLFPMNFFIKN